MKKFQKQNNSTGETYGKTLPTEDKPTTITSDRENDPEVQSNSSLSEISIGLDGLPSKGKVYDENVRITYRPYTYGELLHLSQSSKGKESSNKDKIDGINFALNGIYVQGMNKYDLTLSDFNFIAVLRKISTIGQGELTLTWKCPKCKTDNKSSFTMFDLEFEDLKYKGGDLEINGTELQFRPINLTRYISYLKTINKNYNKDMALMAYQVVNLEFEEAYNIIKDAIDEEDVDALESIDSALYHDTKDMKVSCNKEDCGYSSTIPFQFIDSFIISNKRNKGTAPSKVRFIE